MTNMLSKEQVEALLAATRTLLAVEVERDDPLNKPIKFDRERYRAAKPVFDMLDPYNEHGGLGPKGIEALCDLALQAIDMRPRPISEANRVLHMAFPAPHSPHWKLFTPADDGNAYGLTIESWQGKPKAYFTLAGGDPLLLAAEAMAILLSALPTGGE